MGNFIDDLMDDLFGLAIGDELGLGDLAARNRALANRRLANLGGAGFETARATATSVRSARQQGPLQPGGTRKFVVPRERKRRRGLSSEFNLGDGTGGTAGINIGTGSTFTI